MHLIFDRDLFFNLNAIFHLQEHLPEGYDHDVVREMFERHGAVNYVSLPRNPDKSFKGFAFVEFALHEGAVAAVKSLNVWHAVDNPSGLRVLLKCVTSPTTSPLRCSSSAVRARCVCERDV
jgi:RNA recognition motif-containing protein